MTSELLRELETICQGRVAFCGIGNSDRGDDAVGILIAQGLCNAGVPHVYDGGMTPEKIIPVLRDAQFDAIIFIDAVDMQAEPGSVAILDARELCCKFPQISTHKLSLGTLAKLVTDGNNSRVWLVGIQPETLQSSKSGLSNSVNKTVEFLIEQLSTIIHATSYALQEQVCN